MISEESVYNRLKTVMDPELHVNIVDLGLIYEVTCSVEGDSVVVIIRMTLTTPGCPLAPEIERLVRQAIQPLGECILQLKLEWEPVWTKERMSEEAKLQLGIL